MSFKLKSCLKKYAKDQDKAADPAQTVARVKKRMEEKCPEVLAETERVDTGRLGIPVFVSKCGIGAKTVMPTRKQMGKGASPSQAEASALMELVERYSFFTFWDDESNFQRASWTEAQELWPGQVCDPAVLLNSVGEEMSEEDAIKILDLVSWYFCPALNLATGKTEYIPLDWFRKLNEFNGASAGNTYEESVFQGACELVERHVCAVIDLESPELPTIDQQTIKDPVLVDLCEKFRRNGVRLILKDFSLGMPVPTVAALAYDPRTFPGMSEIVYTAGTAASPEKAAIRAVTEVAQLAGDFETGRVYEASGLGKFTELEQFQWLEKGRLVDLTSLPNVENDDILLELQALVDGLAEKGYISYSVATTHPDLEVPANYNIVSGFRFRERTPNATLGLFVGRILAEECSDIEAAVGLEVLGEIYPGAHFLPFFNGLLALRNGQTESAVELFTEAEPLQPSDDEKALSAFYIAHSMTLEDRWEEAVPHLDRAVSLDDEVKEFYNLRGVARFKGEEFAKAAVDFESALNLDSGSAPVLANLGLCHKFMGNRDQAVDYLESALGLDPELEYAREHLSELE